MINRRVALQGMVAGAGALGLSSAWPLSETRAAAGTPKGTPKRVIFFLQNNGFDPLTCIPRDLKANAPLSEVKLPEPVRALEPYKDRMNIITGLHGRHTKPGHSPYFGALGGYRGGLGVPPAGPTIDHVISQMLPSTLLPHLRLGMDSMAKMVGRPTVATLSAEAASKPLYMHSNPQTLYQTLFGGIAEGDVKKRFEARSSIYDQLESFAQEGGRGLSAKDLQRYGTFVQGFHETNELRDKLLGVSEHLKKFAPAYDERFSRPQSETDWHDAILDIGIAALKSGLSNVLTISSGRGELFLGLGPAWGSPRPAILLAT